MTRFLALVALICLGLAAAAPDASSSRRKDQDALKPFAGLVGDWKGTGQPQRGVAKGAWRESSDWAWKLSADSAALEWKVEGGKYLKSAVLRPGKEPGAVVLETVLPDGSSRAFSGKADAERVLVLTSEDGGDGGPRRIKITPLHDTRLLVLFEGHDSATGRYPRLGEVGYTRQGVAFAAGDSAPVCIVTEGRGTIRVTHKGKTYWVCCTGCKQLFESDPDAILAEAAEKAKDSAK